jgi:Carboxypeptidase regulatory-like domain
MKVLTSFRLRDRRGMRGLPIALGVVTTLLFMILAQGAMAQEFRATLTGLVSDPDGRPVVKAKVTVTNVDTGSSYTDETSNAGVYYIPYVVPGTYTVKAEAAGFKTSIQDKVLLLAGKYFAQNFKLTVGEIHETVEVTAAPPLLETANASGGTILDEKTIQNVPVPGHQIYMLIGTTPGSQFTTTTFGPGGNSGTRGWDVTNQYIIGGGVNPGDTSGGFNQFTLNGTNITQQTTYDNQGAGTWNVAPNLDAVQEVNVMTTTYDARYGRTTGGTVNIVSKNGTNAFHGTLYEGYRDGSLFDANSNTNTYISGAPTQQQVENQFTGTFGGPIMKNKIWFFFSFEGYRQSIYNTVTESLPPAYLRPGYNGNPGVDFSLIQTLDPGYTAGGVQSDPYLLYGLNIFQPGDNNNPANPNNAICSTGGPATLCSQSAVRYPNAFTGGSNVNPVTGVAGPFIPSAQINPTALAILSGNYIPLPNIGGAQNYVGGFGEPANFFAVTPDYYSYNQPMIRVDYNTSDRTKWYSFYEWQKGHENRSGNGLSGVADNGNVNWTRENWAASQDMIHTFSNTLLGDFKLSFSRFVAAVPDGDLSAAKPASSIGLNMPLPPTTAIQDLPEYNIGGLPTVFGNSNNLDATTNITLDVDFTKSKGQHNIHFGGGAAYFTYGNPGNAGNANGFWGFSGRWTQADPFNSNCYQPTNLSGGAPTNLGSGCSSTYAPNGSGWADFLLGLPTGGGSGSAASGVNWNDSLFDYQPVWNLYVQDDWRITKRLSLNLGLRYDVQIGLRERYNELPRGLCLTCVNPITTDGVFDANIANPANLAAWQAAGISPATISTVYGGTILAGHNGQPRNAYDTDWHNIAPRFGFAYAFNPKTVFRGGWGYMYGAGLEGGSPIGYQQTTNYIDTVNGFNPTQGGVAPGAASAGPYGIGTPYPTSAAYPLGLLPPVGAATGLLSGVGQGGITVDTPKRLIPRTQVASFGIQHELPGQTTLDVRWAANYASRLRALQWYNGTITYPELQYSLAPGSSVYSKQVPNPYYGVFSESFPGGCGTSPTIEAIALILPFSQYCSPGGAGPVGEYNDPIGRNWYNGLEVKLTKHTSRGLTFNVAYTWSKTINGDGYQNGYPYQDANEIHWLAGTDRTHVLAMTGVYEVPLGRGRTFLTGAPRAVDYALGGWTLGWTFAAQSGTPVGLNQGFNYSCPFVSPRKATVAQWINPNLTSPTCFTSVPHIGGSGFTYNTTPATTNQIRNPTVPNLDLSLEKDFRITERVKFTLRGEAFNALNSVLLGGPDTTPTDGPASLFFNSTTNRSYWTGFGTVGPNQLNFPRNLRVSGKITF